MTLFVSLITPDTENPILYFVNSTLLVLLGSGILDGDGLRLDCGCLLVDCDSTDEGNVICSSDAFIDSDGEFDWDCDHLQLDLRLLEEEKIGVCSIQLDATIPSLLEIN